MTLRDFTDLPLDDLDRDGALRQAADELERTSRAGFLATAAGGVAAAAALVRPQVAAAALAKSDVAILNYALTLEYLQDAFYTEAERKGALEDRRRNWRRSSERSSARTWRPCAASSASRL